VNAKTQSASSGLLPTFLGVSVAMLVCAGVLIVGLAVRPAGGLGLPAGYHVVHVTLDDYRVGMPAGTVPAGNDVFVVTNHGKIPHELVAFRTKNANARLPLRKNKEVDEESTQIVDSVDTGSALAPGETRLVTATLEAGSYVGVCNLPNHYQLGMHTPFTVK
jgi:uncharacterized cupredoxin-like copper-binding protein